MKTPIITYIIFFLCIASSTLCCTRNEKSNSALTQEVEKQDSTLLWIQESRNTSLSDNERANLLQKAYKNILITQEDSLKVKYFSRLSLAYLKLNDSSQFRRTNKQTISLSKEIQDSTTLAEAHWDLALFFNNEEVKDSSFYHYSQAQKIYQGLKKDLYSARMFYNMGIIQVSIKDYTGAEINIIKAIELFKPLNENRRLYYCYNTLGAIYTSLEEYNMALEFHEEALDYIQKAKLGDDLEILSQNNIGVVYLEKGEERKSLQILKEVVEKDSLLNTNPRLYSKALSSFAYNKYKLKDTSEVRILLGRALKIQDSLHDDSGSSRTLFYLAEYLLSQKDTSAALINAKKAIDYARNSNNNLRVLETLELLPKIDPENAYVYTQKYMNLNDSLQLEERKIRDKFARIRFETNEFIEQNTLLEEQRRLWIGIASSLLLLAVLVFVIISQIIKNQKLKFQQKQQESNQEIFNLMLSQQGKLEEGKHIEQQRISEELHDGILGKMLGIRLILTGLNNKTDDSAVKQRESYIKKMQELEEEIRTISHELNDTSYEKIHNFIISVQELVSTFRETTSLEFNFDYDHIMEWDRLKGDIKINLYRIVQECVQNCIKHAQASTVNIGFYVEETNIKVYIEDDGVGFSVRKEKKGIGLKNISSRTKKLNAKYSIKSEIGKGTVVEITIPIQQSKLYSA